MATSILPQDFPASVKTVFFINEFGENVEVQVEKRPVKLLKTLQEKNEARRQYRKEYMSRPDVQVKVKKRMNDPLLIEKRKEYAARDDVKKRKQELAARSRSIKRILKEREPTLYYNLLTEISSANTEKEEGEL